MSLARLAMTPRSATRRSRNPTNGLAHPAYLPGSEKECLVSDARPWADGGPDMIQLLTPEGEFVETAPQEYRDIAARLSDDDLRGFYRDLVFIRRFDAEATALQRQGELGLWASLLGQEAAQVGSGRALRRQDYAFPTYREHGVAWCRGVDPVMG